MTTEFAELLANNPWMAEIIKQTYIAAYGQAMLDVTNRLKVIGEATQAKAGEKADKFIESLIQGKK